MAQMKTVSLIAANNAQLQEQMQVVLDQIAATLAAAQVAISLLDAKVAAVRVELEKLKPQPQGGDVA